MLEAGDGKQGNVGRQCVFFQKRCMVKRGMRVKFQELARRNGR